MAALQDTPIARGLRKQMIRDLQEKGIHDTNVLKAMAEVPRHVFFPPIFMKQAYLDVAFPIEAGQTISQPSTVAYQTMLLQVTSKHKVLEIGTGSGYQACVLACLGAFVYSIERQMQLFSATRSFLSQLPYRVQCRYGDGSLGLEQEAPFDRILVTAGAPDVPKNLLRQLKIGGILVIPVGDGEKQTMLRITRMDEVTFETEQFQDFRFVPLIGKQGW
jgi:protein-L-isoaspartate(D-aspartate) O-methyltransferase